MITSGASPSYSTMICDSPGPRSKKPVPVRSRFRIEDSRQAIDQHLAGIIEEKDAVVGLRVPEFSISKEPEKDVVDTQETGFQPVFHAHSEGLVLEKNGECLTFGEVLEIIFPFQKRKLNAAARFARSWRKLAMANSRNSTSDS